MELFWQNNQSELRNLPIKSLPENTPFARTQHHPTATRCQTIQPLLPSSSAHSPACGQNIPLLQSQEFFLPWTIPTSIHRFAFRSRLNKRARIQPAATYSRNGLQNQQGGVIVIPYSRRGVLPPPLPPASTALSPMLSRDSK